MAGLIAARGGGPNNALGIAPGAQILPVKIAARVDRAGRRPRRSGGRSTTAPGSSTCPSAATGGALPSGGGPGRRLRARARCGRGRLGRQHLEPGLERQRVRRDPRRHRRRRHDARSTGTSRARPPGAFVAVSAPADGRRQHVPAQRVADTGFGSADGSSNASAIVAGVAALIRSRYPELNAANVVNRILASSVDRGAPGRDPEFGFGTVDAERALTMDIAGGDGEPARRPGAGAGGGPGPGEIHRTRRRRLGAARSC